MLFTSRKTCRAVLGREELAIIADVSITDLASIEYADSHSTLCDHITSCIKRAGESHAIALTEARGEGKRGNTERKLTFHAVQIACDLFTLGIVRLADNGADCPLGTGSAAGIKLVQRWEAEEATVKSLAEQTRREPREVQTSLCD